MDKLVSSLLQRIRGNLLLQVLRELEEESKPQRARKVSGPREEKETHGTSTAPASAPATPATPNGR